MDTSHINILKFSTLPCYYLFFILITSTYYVYQNISIPIRDGSTTNNYYTVEPPKENKIV